MLDAGIGWRLFDFFRVFFFNFNSVLPGNEMAIFLFFFFWRGGGGGGGVEGDCGFWHFSATYNVVLLK